MTKQSYVAIIGVLVLLIGLYAFISRNPAGVDQPDGTKTATQPTPPPTPPMPRPDLDSVKKNWNALLSFADAPPAGSAHAEYTVVEVGDFQCPQCGNSRPLIEKMLKDSNGKAQLYFVNYPLQMHPHARFAAQAAIAAANQGKFWPMYDVLYQNQDMLVPSAIQYYAGKEIPGFNVSKYLADVDSAPVNDRVDKQLQEVRSLKILSTPTIFVRKTSGGDVTWLVGINDTKPADGQPGTLGLKNFVLAPPWASTTKG